MDIAEIEARIRNEGKEILLYKKVRPLRNDNIGHPLKNTYSDYTKAQRIGLGSLFRACYETALSVKIMWTTYGSNLNPLALEKPYAKNIS